MAEVKKEDFFKHLDNLTVLELADYIKEFESRYGIKAEMAAMSAGAAAPAAAACRWKKPAARAFVPCPAIWPLRKSAWN